jgi:cell division protein FtsB
MNAMFNLLDGRDRKILAGLGFLVVLGLAFLFLFGFRQKAAYTRSANSLSRVKDELAVIAAENAEKETEWQKWEQTQLDIKELEEKYFYNEKDGIVRLRRDLQKILQEARIRATDKRYEYLPVKKLEGMRAVRVRFQTFSSYNDLKKFIHSVEVFPKFLLLDKIDFLDVDSSGGGIKLTISLTGYYYEK